MPNTLTLEEIEEMRLNLLCGKAPSVTGYDIDALCDAAKRAVEERWIPVAERLPVEREIVHFVADLNGTPVHCTGYKVSSDPDDARWHDFEQTDPDGEYRDVYGVTHWRPRSPLPSAPTQEPKS